MIVVSDTSPLTALLAVGKADLPTWLFPKPSKRNCDEATLNFPAGFKYGR